jgi:DNA-directed RNA polymerase subunit F
MTVSIEQVKKLLEYRGQPQIKQLALNLSLARLKRLHSVDPESLEQCVEDLNLVIEKFAAVIEPDYKWIISL